MPGSTTSRPRCWPLCNVPRKEQLELAQEANLPFPLLVDEDGRIHRSAGAADKSGHPAIAIYITDRFGEVFAVYRAAEGQTMPSAQEIIKWLTFINIQCPECWPSRVAGIAPGCSFGGDCCGRVGRRDRTQELFERGDSEMIRLKRAYDSAKQGRWYSFPGREVVAPRREERCSAP